MKCVAVTQVERGRDEMSDSVALAWNYQLL